MSRRDSRPWGPGGENDRDDVPQEAGRAWGGVDVPPGPEVAEFHRPFGGTGWRGMPVEARLGALDPEEGEQAPGEGDPEESGHEPKRRRAREAPAHPRRPLTALGSTVRVVRDDLGVPHIAAKSERDAWAALGWCMADDRRRQMDLLRRLAHGRAAEILGPDFVSHDALVRTAGVSRRAVLAASRLPGAVHDVLASFAAGVNSALADMTGPATADAVVEPWTIADTLAIEILRAFATSLHVWPAKLLLGRTIAVSGPRRAEWIAGELPPGASDATRLRAWASLDASIAELVASLPVDAGLDGAASAIAAPDCGELVAVLHASPAMPSAFYEAHLETPTLHLAGGAPVGVPAFHVGRTRELAWAGVPAIVDDCDVVLEDLDGIGNRRTPSGWEKLATRRETIRVRDGEPVVVEVVETRNGPLVSHLARQLAGMAPDPRIPAVALHWGAGTLFSSVAAWLGLARAGDVAAAEQAVAAFERSTQPVRVVVADRSGRTGAASAGCVPSREPGCRLPLLGWKGEGAWTGVSPVARGWSLETTSGQALAVAGEGGPSAPGPSETAGRLRLLEPGSGARGAATDSTLDTVDPVLRAILPVLRRALADSDDPAAGEVAATIGDFDGELREDDRATAVVLAAFHHFLPSELFPTAGFGPIASFPRVAGPATQRILLAPSSPWFADGTARDRAVASALLRAAAWLGHAEATTGRSACSALFRSPARERPTEEGAGVAAAPICGSPASLAMLDWRGPLPPFRSVSHRRCARSARSPMVGCGWPSAEASPRSPVTRIPWTQLPGFVSGRLHPIDLAAPAVGEILDLAAGS